MKTNVKFTCYFLQCIPWQNINVLELVNFTPNLLKLMWKILTPLVKNIPTTSTTENYCVCRYILTVNLAWLLENYRLLISKINLNKSTDRNFLRFSAFCRYMFTVKLAWLLENYRLLLSKFIDWIVTSEKLLGGGGSPPPPGKETAKGAGGYENVPL